VPDEPVPVPVPPVPPPDIEPTEPKPEPEKKSWLRRTLEGLGLGTVLGGVSLAGVKLEVDHLFILALCLLVIVGSGCYWFLTRRKR